MHIEGGQNMVSTPWRHESYVDRTVYRRTKVNPLKVGELLSNIFRVMSNVAELNKRLGLHLTEHDISFIYNYQDSKTSDYYVRNCLGEVRLMYWLPDSDRETEGDFLMITRN